MKHPFTTTLSDWAYHFLNAQSKRENRRRNDVIEKALKIYHRIVLQEQVKQGLLDRKEEYRQIANEFAEAQFKSLLNNESNL